MSTPRTALKATGVRRRDARCPETELATLTAERDQLRSDCENETKWAAHYLAQSIAEKARAARAEAEVERLRSDTRDVQTQAVFAEADLAIERARLDWLMAGGMCLVQHSGGFHVCRLNCQVSRAAIDAGMKEGAK